MGTIGTVAIVVTLILTVGLYIRSARAWRHERGRLIGPDVTSLGISGSTWGDGSSTWSAGSDCGSSGDGGCA